MKILLHKPLLIEEMGLRTNQEDFAFPASPSVHDRLFVLCDGMGGHLKGEVASKAVTEGIVSWYKRNFKEGMVMTDVMFDKALEVAYQRLDDAADDESSDMGTTLTCLFFHKGGCLAAHMGDSRIYHVRPSDNKMLYKSKDHSLVCELYEAGQLSFSEMSTSPKRNIITRAMIPGLDNREEADIVHIKDIKEGDYFFLCSDGMLERMADDELINILAGDEPDLSKRQRLIEASDGNNDNHTALIIHVAGVQHEENDGRFADDEASSPYNALLMRRDDEDEDGTVTVVGGSQPQKAIPDRNSVEKQGQTASETKEKIIDDKSINNTKRQTAKPQHSSARLRFWLVAMAAAVLTAAFLVLACWL